MKLNSVTRFLVEKILKMSEDNAYEYLKNRGFDLIGKGSESYVYSRKGFEYVIKIQHNYGGYVKVKHVPCDKHFANQEYFHGKEFNVIIQEKCERFTIGDRWDHTYNHTLFNRWRRFSKFLQDKFNVGDTHDFNMGTKNGRLVSIDWNH